MKAGMILGIVAGVLGLIIGSVGYSVASVGNSLAGAGGAEGYFNLYKYGAVLTPLLCLVGAAMTYKSPGFAASAMALSAVAMVLIFGFHMFSILTVVLAGLGAFMVFSDMQKTPYQE